MFQRSLKFLSFSKWQIWAEDFDWNKVYIVNLQKKNYDKAPFMDVSTINALVMLVLTCSELKFVFLSVAVF